MTATPRTVATPTHGRYLVAAPPQKPLGLLVGFHGYAESADVHLQAIQSIPGVDRWLTVAVQALHPFYTRDQRIVASWMTSLDRELAIADNIEYVRRVVDEVHRTDGLARPLVFAGFSQGAAMAYRAAADQAADALIILAGDVPPDVAGLESARLPPVLIGRGTADTWYTRDKHDADLAALRRLDADVRNCVFDGGHEWSPAFREAAAEFLSRFG